MKNLMTTKILTATFAVTLALSGVLTVGCGNDETKETSVSFVSSTSESEIEIADAESAKLTITVTADEGWTEDSTPAIARIEGEDVDFYTAIYADEAGNIGTSSVTVPVGKYTISFVSPVNSDGSAYTIYDTSEDASVTVVAATAEAGEDDEAETASESVEIAVYDVETASASIESFEADDDENTVVYEMEKIPAEDVTDEMLIEIIEQVKEAIANGDETLTDNESEILEKLEENVASNPNVSDETITTAEEAVAESTSDNDEIKSSASGSTSGSSSSTTSGTTSSGTTSSGTSSSGSSSSGSSSSSSTNSGSTSSGTSSSNNSSSSSSSSGNSSSGSSSSSTSTSTHTHTWVDHTATRQVWVENLVQVPIYEKVMQYKIRTFLAEGVSFIIPDEQDECDAYVRACAVRDDITCNYQDKAVYEDVITGYTTEDQGYYKTETYVDYQYCSSCGATK